jgi:hypothetical protein
MATIILASDKSAARFDEEDLGNTLTPGEDEDREKAAK